MVYTYRMREDPLRDEQGIEWKVYGIEAVDSAGNILCCFPDIFFDRERAKAFVRSCNVQRVELLHMQDVIDNVLAEQYTP